MPNIYPFGQCTWWCADQEPWCERYGNLGNALDWASNWRARRGFVQMTPAVGTIACFQPGSDGADARYGHVAVVIPTAIVVPGRFMVSEMNGPAGPGRTDDRACQNNPGVSFLVEFAPTPPEDNDLTPAESQMLKDIHDALFLPVAQDGGQGYPNYANPNVPDIIRRVVSPYAKGYPPANPPVAP
jgi:surface antigen